MLASEKAYDELVNLIQQVGPGFHPDTPMTDYVRHDGTPSFKGKDLREKQYLLHELWDFYGPSIYNESMKIHLFLYPQE